MKAILEFNLPDDREEYLRATKAEDMASVLWKIIHNTKKGLQNEIESKGFDGYETLDRFYEMLWQELLAHNIDIDQLYS